MAFDYKHFKKRVGLDNAPGLKKKAFAAPRSWFAATGGLAVPTPDPMNPVPGENYLITGNHTFETGKGFIELYGTLDTAELTAETVGDRDSRTTNPKFVFQNPGLDAEGIEFAEMAKNDEWIILVEQLNGTFIQLGQDGLECDLVPSRSSGKVSGGYTGQTFTAESFGPVFIYQGDITMKP
jgi:hypothetical protein